ncbi:uncharacterized protein Z518_07048 [Rhinocladiella mackenziei CBS 650.93]|uniref:AAA-ATPase-like domain-containing protein n=1 Tax=Rhinocladiella mackenziei CBS 650.93 TaxID=1442369 RepID=A0A0D2J3H4_9EURO|nr:uncharacterized protein Z518_07048 [Rhinocladiella mackenziei CBS 650.93]KIX03495.1 hypothetical protein Z518_07048 [Rhinocladiella mackenziei CBS 650.93]
MDSFPEHSPKQAGQAKPTIEEIKEWDADELLEWIQQNKPKQLKGHGLEKFKAADISGEVFLILVLANLAREMAGKERDTSIEHTTDPSRRKRKSPPHTDITPLPKRTRVGNSRLIVNGKLKHFRSGFTNFSNLLQEEGQAYFDRTRYIFMLHELDKSILFCRPRRFGKTLTASMLEHFHGLQYAGEHQSLYKGLDVQKDIDERQAEEENCVKPRQYFVMKFDFSKINPHPDLTKANEALIRSR